MIVSPILIAVTPAITKLRHGTSPCAVIVDLVELIER